MTKRSQIHNSQNIPVLHVSAYALVKFLANEYVFCGLKLKKNKSCI